MKLNEIIKTTATLIGREDVCEYLRDTTITPKRQTFEAVDLLTRLANLVIKELAEGQIYLIEEEEINGVSVEFSSLDKKIIEVIAAYDEWGNQLDYQITPFSLTANGALIKKLKYSYLPDNYGLQDKVGTFERRVTVGILSYGVAAEYCLTQGKFEEAITWNERYTKSIENLCKPKNAVVKERRFI